MTGYLALYKEDEMRTPILVGLIFTSSLAVRAADKVQPLDVKLGLWEVTATVTTSGQMPVPADLLARWTPEQRARVEDRLKAQSSGSTKTTTRRHCVTREDLDKGTSFGEDRKSCTRTVVSSSKSQLEMRLECEDQGMKSVGRFQVEAIDSENVKGSIHLTASSGDHTMNSGSNLTGKWIGAVCGEARR